MAKIEYGIATYDRWNGVVSSEFKLPLTNVRDGGFIEFFESAGANGWELCGSFPSGTKGHKVAQPHKAETKECTDPTEYITFIFKKV